NRCRTRVRWSSPATARPIASRHWTRAGTSCSWSSPTAPTGTAAIPPAASCTSPSRTPPATSWWTSTGPTTRHARSPPSRPARCRRRRTGSTWRSTPARRPTPSHPTPEVPMRLTALLLAPLLLLSAPAPAAADTPPVPLLWKVSDADNSLYLLGSFHMLQPGDYPLSHDVDDAFGDAEEVLFEMSPAEMASPTLALEMGQAALRTDGTRLDS